MKIKEYFKNNFKLILFYYIYYKKYYILKLLLIRNILNLIYINKY